jgi:hypothetical protein
MASACVRTSSAVMRCSSAICRSSLPLTANKFTIVLPIVANRRVPSHRWQNVLLCLAHFSLAFNNQWVRQVLVVPPFGIDLDQFTTQQRLGARWTRSPLRRPLC